MAETNTMKLGLILNASNRMGSGINSAIGMLGKIGGVIGAANLAFMGYDAVTKYDDSIASLSAVTGTTGKDLDELKSQVLSLAKESKVSADEIAAGFENVGSNMSEYLSDPKGLRMITSAGVTLAKAARMEIGPALDNVTTIMNQFDLKAQDAAKTVNILSAGEIVGNVRTREISTSLQEFGASASGAGVTLAESVTMIEVLGKKLKSAQIGVAGRNILLAMSAVQALPREAQLYLQKYGVSTDILMNKQLPLIQRLRELKKVSGDSAAMVKVFGEGNVTAATILLNSLPIYDDWNEKINDTNEVEKQAEINSKSFLKIVEEMKAAFGNTIVSINENSGALGVFGGVLEFVTEHMSTLINLVITAGGIWLAFKIIINGVKAATWLYVFATDAAELSQNGLLAANLRGTAALKIMQGWIWLTSAATWNWAAALWATGIPEIVIGIVALIAGLILLVKYWDEVSDAIIRFGEYLLKWVIHPFTLLLEAIGKLTGADWAIKLSTNMADFERKLDTDRSRRNYANEIKAGVKKEAVTGSSNSSIVYSPNINIASGTAADKESFMQMLKGHKREISQMMGDIQNDQRRTNYVTQ